MYKLKIIRLASIDMIIVSYLVKGLSEKQEACSDHGRDYRI